MYECVDEKSILDFIEQERATVKQLALEKGITLNPSFQTVTFYMRSGSPLDAVRRGSVFIGEVIALRIRVTSSVSAFISYLDDRTGISVLEYNVAESNRNTVLLARLEPQFVSAISVMPTTFSGTSGLSMWQVRQPELYPQSDEDRYEY